MAKSGQRLRVLSNPDDGYDADFGRRGGGGPPTINPSLVVFGLIALVLIYGAFTAAYTVEPEERGVVKRFGAVVGISEPGLHFKLPFGIDTVQLVATERVLKEEFGFRTLGQNEDRTAYGEDNFDESLMLSGDLNMVVVDWVVQYRIADPIKYLYAMRDPVRTLRDISESVMRRAVGNRLGSEVLTTARVDISNRVRDEIQEAMVKYDNGLQVATVELQDVVPPPAVQPAFNEVNEARQARERLINEATKRANEEIPKAEGEANRTIAQAEGYATERVNNALGESSRFVAILDEYRKAPNTTRTRLYLEAIGPLLQRVDRVVISRDGNLPALPTLNLNEQRAAERRGEN